MTKTKTCQSADSSACWNQSSTYNIDESDPLTSSRIELHCLIIEETCLAARPPRHQSESSSLLGQTLCDFFLRGGGRRGEGGTAVRQASIRANFHATLITITPSSSGHALTTLKTPPRCFGLASEGLPRRLQSHHAYKSCIAFAFVWFIHVFVVRQTNTRIARIMQKPTEDQ